MYGLSDSGRGVASSISASPEVRPTVPPPRNETIFPFLCHRWPPCGGSGWGAASSSSIAAAVASAVAVIVAAVVAAVAAEILSLRRLSRLLFVLVNPPPGGAPSSRSGLEEARAKWSSLAPPHQPPISCRDGQLAASRANSLAAKPHRPFHVLSEVVWLEATNIFTITQQQHQSSP